MTLNKTEILARIEDEDFEQWLNDEIDYISNSSYDDGYEDGRSEGYDDGCADGRSDGYDEGYEDGLAEGD